jgi:hypothetical protein
MMMKLIKWGLKLSNRDLKRQSGSINSKVPADNIIEDIGAFFNEKGEEQPLKTGDFALVNPNEKNQCLNKGNKPVKMVCWVPKELD